MAVTRGLRAPWWAVPLAIFAASRSVSAILLVVVGHDQIHATQLPQHMPMPTLVDPPSYLHLIANWDGQWYRQIAAHGYPGGLPTIHGVVQQSAWAFYPLFPALVRLLMSPGLSFGAAASVVSLASGAAAVCVLFHLLRCSGPFTAALTVLAVCMSPASPVLQAAYTESLAFLLLLIALWGLHEGRHGVFCTAGVLLSLTRAITPPLALVALGVYASRRRSVPAVAFPAPERRSLLGGALIVGVASLLWPAVVSVATGDLTAYEKVQAAWATVAGNNASPWLVTMVHNPVQLLVVSVGLALLIAVCVGARSWPLVLRLWPVPYVVFILAVTPATASVLRFSILAGAPWWPAPGWSHRLTTWGKVALVCGIVAVGLALQWWWLRTYFVIDPYSHGHP